MIEVTEVVQSITVDETTYNIEIKMAGTQGPPGNDAPSDHGELTGLGDDDHTQYHNDSRGDIRYYTKTQSDTNYEPKNSNIQSHIASTSNPHGVTKAQVGLGNVDNTSDADKPISSATQSALDDRVPYVGAAADIDLGNSQRVTNCQDPANPQDVATKNYIDEWYVPYTGATSNLDLGANTLSAAAVTASSGLYGSNLRLVHNGSFSGYGYLYYDDAYARYKLLDGDENIAKLDVAEISSNSVRVLDAVSGTMHINGGDIGIDVNNTYLGNYGVQIYNWTTGNFFNGIGYTANVMNGYLIDPYTTVNSVEWFSRYLKNNSGTLVYDWQNGEFFNEYSYKVLEVNGYQSRLNSVNGSISMDAQTRTLYDDTGIAAMTWDTSTSFRALRDPTGEPSVAFGAARSLVNSSGITVYDWEYGLIYDSLGVSSLEIDNRLLRDSTSGTSIDYGQRILKTSTGVECVYWDSYKLADTSGAQALRWDTRYLINAAGSALLGWPGSAIILAGSTDNSNNGAIWYSTTNKNFGARLGSVTTSLQSTLFTQTATGTAANTVSETTITSTGVGTLTLPTDFLLAGKTIKITGHGIHSASGSPSITIKVKLGSTVVLTTGSVATGNTTNEEWEIAALITCRTAGSSGTVFAQGCYIENASTPRSFGMANTSATTINTTTSQALTITAQWTAANVANTISLTNLVVEVLN